MRCFSAFLIVLTLAGALLAPPSSTRIAAAQGSCAILVLEMGNAWDTESLDAIGGINYTAVSPAAFATADLSQYDALYVPSAFQDAQITIPSQASLDALNARSADIATYVSNGGGLIALAEPIGAGRFAWVPLPVTPGPREDLEEVLMTLTGHPAHVGLSGADLSFWHQSTHHSTTPGDPEYFVLTRIGSSDAPLSLYAIHGDGRIYLTGQDPDFHMLEIGGSSPADPEAGTLIGNTIDWMCNPESVGGEVVLPDLARPPLAATNTSDDSDGHRLYIGVGAGAALLLAGAAVVALRRRMQGSVP